MWCGQKFTQGHKCIRSHLYHILIEDIEDIEWDLEEFLDCVDNLEKEGQKENGDSYNPLYHYMFWLVLKDVKP